jgi:hypothetical protein
MRRSRVCRDNRRRRSGRAGPHPGDDTTATDAATDAATASDEAGAGVTGGGSRGRGGAALSAREAFIAEAIANMGSLTAEQRDQLSMLLPSPPAAVSQVTGGTRLLRGDGEASGPRRAPRTR